jgi:hypothetical protein
MTIINLENLEGLPYLFLNKLRFYDRLFEKNNSLEDFYDVEEIQNIISEINDYCCNNLVIGFHYTRTNPDNIRKYGLLCRDGNDIRNSFLENYKYLFTQEEIETIILEWDRYFSDNTKKSRDYKIYFNFTKNALKNLSAEFLLENFGGEQIYMPIHSIENIRNKLRNIGTPLILKCKLNPKNIKTHIINPWGQIAVSSYHRLKNVNANIIDLDGCQSQNLSFDNIEIIEYRKGSC